MRLWVSEIGEEVIYEQDLPDCCHRGARSEAREARSEARSSEDGFECVSCGARWQAAVPVEPEGCAFMERAAHERKGAA